MSALRDELRAGSAGSAVGIRDLHKSFGETEILHGFDLDVPAGQFLAIVGRSGCGKSTLLRILAGLEEPTSGDVTIGAETPGAGPTRLMFQEPRLLPWADVLSNVEVGLGPERARSDARARASATLAHVGLGRRAAEWPGILSGGQRQRVALARALVSKPGLLALDEPLGALDALTRIEMQALLERVWLEQRFTAVLVTHDVAEAIALADRIILIEDGAIGLDVEVDLPRPRRRGSVDFARLEESVLKRLVRDPTIDPDYVI
jgi:sulfonate transport system ATP-binding protein